MNTAVALLLAVTAVGQAPTPKRILLRSSWQTVNIGDIAHTPGVLRLLEEHLPGVEVRLWPSSVADGVEALLLKRFPKLVLVKSPEAVQAAFAECDFFLHGSGPSLVAAKDLARWHRETGKPYGVYGITCSATDQTTLDLLSGARFVFFRDSVSLQFAKDHGVHAPVMEFGPDGAFAADVRNDEAATAFLLAHELTDGQFLCCIPRLRTTPYWKIRGKAMTPTDEANHRRNFALQEHDNGPLREATIAVVRQTGLKVLLVPEDQSQMAVGKELIYDQLPADVRPRVVWRERFWLTDEAISTYVRSAGLFGCEMHSPIMCVGNRIPALVCRWAQQTSKGYMWRDIGLGEWLFNMDQEDEIKGIVPAVLALAKDPAAARAKADKAREFVLQRQRETMAVLRRELAATHG